MNDWKIWLSYILMLSCGVLIGYDISSDSASFNNLSSWLSALGTLLAVVVALYTTRLNIDRDTYKLKCNYIFMLSPIFEGDNKAIQNSDLRTQKSLKIRVVNVGLRPIAITSFIIKNVNVSVVMPINNIKLVDDLYDKTPLQPGDYREWFLPDYAYPDDKLDVDKCDFFIVDAVGKSHKALETDNPF